MLSRAFEILKDGFHGLSVLVAWVLCKAACFLGNKCYVRSCFYHRKPDGIGYALVSFSLKHYGLALCFWLEECDLFYWGVYYMRLIEMEFGKHFIDINRLQELDCSFCSVSLNF